MHRWKLFITILLLFCVQTFNAFTHGSWIDLSTTGSYNTFFAIDFKDASTSWACGAMGKIIHYTNASPQISAPTAHDFGTVICTNFKVDTIYVSNKGQAPLIISSAPITGPNASEFTLTSPTTFPVTIAAGDSIAFVIRFTQSTWGSKTATVKINSNDPVNPEWSISLTAVKNQADGSLIPTLFDFGPFCLGTTLTRNMALIVLGNQNATLLSFTLVSGDSVFSIVSPSIPSTLSYITPNILQVQFHPTQPGIFTTVYKIVLAPCNQEILLTLKGRGLQSLAKFIPDAGYNFGNVEVGQSVSKTFKIQGNGNVLSHIVSIALKPPQPELSLIGVPSTPFDLNVGDEKTFTVKFTPTSPVPVNSNLCAVWYGVCNDSICVPILGQGVVQPKFSAPGFKYFSPILCTNSIDDTIKIKNIGTAPLEISDAQFTGSNPTSFTIISPSFPATVSPKDSINLIIRFSDNTAGIKTASLVLTHNDAPNSPTSIALSAQRNIASFSVQGDSLQAIESCVGSGTARSLKIFNDGSVPLTIKNINVIQNGNIFHVSSNTLPFVIQPGQNSPFEINFTPLTIGQIEGQILISVEPCGVTHLLTIQGLGNKTLATAAPASVQFGDVKTGTSADQIVEFTNTGSISSVVDKIFINPPAASLQLISPPATPFRFEVGQNFSVTVRYSPTNTGPVKASLCFRTSTPCQDTICIPIDGNGISATISVNRSSLSFALPACNLSSQYDTVTITNAGTSTVEINDLSITQSGNVFSLQPKPALPLDLTVGQTYSLIIQSSALFSGNASGTLTITSTDQQRPKIDISLSARRDSSSITVSSQNISFGTFVPCDSSKTMTMTVTNTGTVGEIITADAITEPAFTLIDPFPIILQAGESKQMSVRFSPKQNRSYRDSLILYSSVCKKRYNIVMSGERINLTVSISPANIDFKQVAVGSTASRTIRITNTSAIKMHLLNMTITPISSGFELPTSITSDIDSNAFVDLTFSFTPQDTIPRTMRACFIFDSPCPDTLCIDISGQGVRSSILISKSQLQFGKLAQCEVQHDTVTCTNTGNAAVDITSSTITGVGASSFSILNPTVSTEILNPNQSRAYYVDFHPSSTPDGIVDATLEIQTTDTQRPTIDIPLQGERVTQVAPTISNVDFGNVNVGETKTVQAFVKNTGTSSLCIDSVSLLPPNVTLLTPLPLCLQAGEQKNISLSFAPAVIETLSTFIKFLMNTPCNDSVNVQLIGNAVAGGLIQTAAIQFGMIASCLTKSDTIIIENKYSSPGRDAILENISITGTDSNLFTIIQPTSLPIIIATNSSQRIVILFDASPTIDGIKQAQCRTILKVDTSMRTFTTQLNATVVTPIITVNQVSFPMTTIGLSANQTTTIINSNPFPIIITKVSTSDSAFAVQSTTPLLPATLQSGQSLNVTLRFAPTMEKVYSATLDVQSNSPCSITGSGNISGGGKAQSITTVSASIDSYHARLDEIISVPILLDADVGAANVASWSGDLSFNRTMLYPRRIAIENSLSKNMNVSSTYDHKTGTLHLAASGGTLLSGNKPLIIIELQALLGNDVETAITIAPAFDFTSGNARIVKRTNGLFQLEGYCRAGDRLLQILGTYSLQQNRPNPFSAAGGPTTKIEYEIAVDGYVSLIVLDVMGREVDQLVNEYKKMGRYEVEFHSRDLPSGMYYYMLRSGRFSDVKKMVIAR